MFVFFVLHSLASLQWGIEEEKLESDCLPKLWNNII